MANLINPENRFGLVQFSGPAGAGKGPICQALTEMGPQLIGKKFGPFDRGAAFFRPSTVLARELGIDLSTSAGKLKLERATKN